MCTLIIGCGFLGRRVAGRCLTAGDRVRGLVRSPASAEELSRRGIEPVVVDLDRGLPAGFALPAGGKIFYFAPPPSQGNQDPRVANLLSTVRGQKNPPRIVYLSTTGVYGDCAGAWIDETRPPAPKADRALRRWDAEQRFRAWRQAAGWELVILRVAGIYWPGRLPLERLRKGLPLIREQEAPFSNRIHVDDLVNVCTAAMQRGGDGEVYNVSDGHPSTMTDYFTRLADVAGLPRPPQIPLSEGEGSLSAGMLSYLRESRRLSNKKMLRELGIRLRYPSLQSGLPACFEPGAAAAQ